MRVRIQKSWTRRALTHSAALTNVLFMKSNRSLIELATTDCQTPKHFQQMALINNINYHRC
jgi:hypothetical protein